MSSNPHPDPGTPSPSTPPKHVTDYAVEVAGFSPCRSKRGVVVFYPASGDIVASGYNYKPRGFECDGSMACKVTCRHEAVHAEQHALIFGQHVGGADMVHVKVVDGQLVPSGGPSCVACSKLIVAANVAAVWLFHADGWRRYAAREFHERSLEVYLHA